MVLLMLTDLWISKSPERYQIYNLCRMVTPTVAGRTERRKILRLASE
jgi:hypothetical protein